MPTKEWLQQHTKVQAYLDDELAAKLSSWMKAQNIEQFSQAVVVILEHYLNDRPPSTISSQVLFDEVESLKREVDSIKTLLVEAGAKALSPKMPAEIAIAPTKRVDIEYTEAEAQAGLTKTQLCDRLNLTLHQAEKAAKEQKMTINDYLLKVTGWKPSEGKRPRYYPSKES
ncbi:hypothetical protein [Merismopedia glauca]|uniref:Uncharacterized protein n=1 Tax=Merismopedia glauca CCAP 1448/3 TaxID=1296344 RepID=A0A2T1BXZ9_9CYAN|nr:hypothetical protein [Merismopedia glauca]PSB00905.1 hypothetical protein C7B64_21040 [Merismopedia glauca CCAP 1448/3]